MNNTLRTLLLCNLYLSFTAAAVTPELLRQSCLVTSPSKCEKLIFQLSNEPYDTALKGTGYYYLSEQATTKEKKANLLAKAQHFHKQARSLAPDNTSVLLEAAVTSTIKEQITIYEHVILLNPERYLPYYLLSQSYLNLPDPNDIKAINILRKGYQYLRDADRLFIADRLYSLLLQLEHQQKAEQFSQEVLKDVVAPINLAHPHQQLPIYCNNFVMQLNDKICSDNLKSLLSKLNDSNNTVVVSENILFEAIERFVFHTHRTNKTAKKVAQDVLQRVSEKQKQTSNYLIIASFFSTGSTKINMLKQAIEMADQNQAKAYYRLGAYYQKQNLKNLAKQTYEKIITYDDNHWAQLAKGQLLILENSN